MGAVPITSLLERVKGIEPSLRAWEARVLPLNYTRIGRIRAGHRHKVCLMLFQELPEIPGHSWHSWQIHGNLSSAAPLFARGEPQEKTPAESETTKGMPGIRIEFLARSTRRMAAPSPGQPNGENCRPN